MTKQFSIYDLIEGGETVYVGCTTNAKHRFSEHKNRGTCASDAEMQIIAQFKDREQALEFEAKRISAIGHYAHPLWSPICGKTHQIASNGL